jgi:hypothetical protein
VLPIHYFASIIYSNSVSLRARVEVSLFVLSPEIEDRDEVEVELGQAQKDSTLLFYLQADQIGHELI